MIPDLVIIGKLKIYIIDKDIVRFKDAPQDALITYIDGNLYYYIVKYMDIHWASRLEMFDDEEHWDIVVDYLALTVSMNVSKSNIRTALCAYILMKDNNYNVS